MCSNLILNDNCPHRCSCESGKEQGTFREGNGWWIKRRNGKGLGEGNNPNGRRENLIVVWLLQFSNKKINPFASEAVYTRNLFSTACRTACKHAFCFWELGRKPCQHATRGCDKRWMTCIHAGVFRSPREHASAPPDKRHCRQGMSEWNGMSE